jgi:hypothetical protein
MVGITIGNVAPTLCLRDTEAHAGFLVALPILIGAELLVHSRIRTVVHRFVEYRLVLPEDKDHYQQAIGSAVKIRGSVYAELAVITAV